jgi:hypothetical protein
MSAWRRIAIEMFPERRRLIQDNSFVFSIYSMFFELLPLAREAHEHQDADLLQRIYRYAEWCWQQRRRSKYVYDAAAVAFYEHLVDRPDTLQAIPQWLKPPIFEDMIGVFRPRLEKEEFKKLLANYDDIHGTQFAEKYGAR